MDILIGLVLAVVLAAVTMAAGAWLRLNKGIELGRTSAFWVGLVAAAVLFTALRVGTSLSQQLISGVAIGIGVGIGQGFRGTK